jgi:hypothetical protein
MSSVESPSLAFPGDAEASFAHHRKMAHWPLPANFSANNQPE